jgi:hypothetical protein
LLGSDEVVCAALSRVSGSIQTWKVDFLLEWHKTEIASRLHGPVVDHGAYKLAMVHVVAELQIGFAVVDENMRVDESSEQLNMICCFDT